MESLAELTHEQFESTRKLVYKATGIRVADGKSTLLSNRLRRRMRVLGLTDFDDYLSLLESARGRAEFPEFINAVTTNETFFFRNPEQFEWLKREFLAEATVDAAQGRRRKSLRIWSAACSTGAEPYSIAICLLENRLKLNDWELTVVASDISRDVLEKAEEGVYKERLLEHVSESQLRRYFQKRTDGETWQVKPPVRELVQFEQHNLLGPFHKSEFDCIFLKNVMIYFDADSKRTVVANLIRRLAPGGYLVIGLSEGVFEMLDPLVKLKPWLFQKKAS